MLRNKKIIIKIVALINKKIMPREFTPHNMLTLQSMKLGKTFDSLWS